MHFANLSQVELKAAKIHPLKKMPVATIAMSICSIIHLFTNHHILFSFAFYIHVQYAFLHQSWVQMLFAKQVGALVQLLIQTCI